MMGQLEERVGNLDAARSVYRWVPKPVGVCRLLNVSAIQGWVSLLSDCCFFRVPGHGLREAGTEAETVDFKREH